MRADHIRIWPFVVSIAGWFLLKHLGDALRIGSDGLDVWGGDD